MRPLPDLNKQARPIVTSHERLGGAMDAAEAARLLHKQRLTAAAAEHADRADPAVIDGGVEPTRHVKYSVRSAPIDEVVKVLLSDLLGRSYAFEPALVKQKPEVTLQIDEEMTDRDIMDLVGALAALQGWAIDRRGDVLIFAPDTHMSRSATSPFVEAMSVLPTDETAMRVFRLSHLTPSAAAEALKDLISTGAKTVVAGRTLLVLDRVRQINRIAKVLAALDEPAFEGAEIWTYQMTAQSAVEAAKTLQTIAQASSVNSANDAAVTFVPLAEANRLMVISRSEALQGIVRNWVEQVDQPAGASYRQMFTYRIQHMDATTLGALLKEVFAERLERSKDDPMEAGMRLTLAVEEELLTVLATPQDFADLYNYLSRVDVQRQQVTIDTVAAEVTLSDRLQWGVEYFLQSELDNGILELIGSATQFGPLAPTGVASFIATDGFAVVEALDQETHVELLSRPSLTLMDKEEGAFQVGAEVPIITSQIDSSTQTDGNTGIRNDVDYRETGVILNIQPRINESGDVVMRITFEVLDAVQNQTSGIDSPAFTKRKVETTVLVPHGRTLLLAGIVQNRKTNRVGKVPILGEIPIVGLAFQNVDNSTERTEILVAITPKVVNTPEESDGVLSDFLAGAYGVKAALESFDAPLAVALTPDLAVGMSSEMSAPRIIDGPAEPQQDPQDAPRESAQPGRAPAEGRRDKAPDPGAPATSARSLGALASSLDAGDEGALAVAVFLRGLESASGITNTGTRVR